VAFRAQRGRQRVEILDAALSIDPAWMADHGERDAVDSVEPWPKEIAEDRKAVQVVCARHPPCGLLWP
jgi:hypothetical protein